VIIATRLLEQEITNMSLWFDKKSITYDKIKKIHIDPFLRVIHIYPSKAIRSIMK